ncbi:MFS transporter [Thioclava sp. JM3]|uniref:MFS transporter n=1 Tax=Thioclava sp. JM3 TaxID=1973004 RepID=UPI000B547065|nr:MFS transporter [Thioclava sp. JM3]OWY16018.1 MFS transporter [Thioclava sp. JM3]
MSASDTSFSSSLFETLTGDAPGNVKELSDTAAKHEPGSFLRHVGSLSMTKLADGLIDPKLVLSWLMQAVGAPAALVSWLVPVREAGSLLPQLFTAPHVRKMPQRKWAWAAGSMIQGLAAAAIVVIALTMQGMAAGLAMLAALGVLAIARSLSSVSYKDVLGKTVDRTRRGTTTGIATSVSAAGVILFALILMSGFVPRMSLVIGAISLAAVLWVAAAALFSTLREEDQPGEAKGSIGLSELSLLWKDADLGKFVIARVLLLPTALAPPYIVLLAANAGDNRFGALGAMVLASALASLVSSYIWGRLADRSSRKVLIFTGLVAAAFLALAVGLSWSGLMGTIWASPVALFGLMIGYQGVRLGRSTYLVDMSPKDDRAAYTAVSNTSVGVMLLAFGAASSALAMAGPDMVLIVYAGICVVASGVAFMMKEVSE